MELLSPLENGELQQPSFFDVVKFVVQHLSSLELATLACVSRDANTVVREDYAWRGACERELKQITEALAPRSFGRWRDLRREAKARNTPVATILTCATSVSSQDR